MAAARRLATSARCPDPSAAEVAAALSVLRDVGDPVILARALEE